MFLSELLPAKSGLHKSLCGGNNLDCTKMIRPNWRVMVPWQKMIIV